MNDFKRYKFYFIFLFCVFLQFQNLVAKENEINSISDTILFPPDFFDIETPLNITLQFDIKEFKREKSDKDYLPSKLTYFIEDTVEVKKNVRVKARGVYRKNHCIFSPYWLNIKKANIVDDHISNVNKVKIVSHCKESKLYSSYLLKEFVAYKLYNMITDYSFKVRLIKVKYIDTGRNNKETEHWAFVIEPQDLMAERLEAYPLKLDQFKFGLTDTTHSTLVSIFQYMIGNTDYSVAGRHNLKLFTFKDHTKPGVYMVPYDFDFSGLVNAFYAIPAAELPIKSVTERYFEGMCMSDKTYNDVLELFKEKEKEIFYYIESFEHFDKKTRKYVINYIEEFYEQIHNPKFIKRYIRPRCR